MSGRHEQLNVHCTSLPISHPSVLLFMAVWNFLCHFTSSSLSMLSERYRAYTIVKIHTKQCAAKSYAEEFWVSPMMNRPSSWAPLWFRTSCLKSPHRASFSSLAQDPQNSPALGVDQSVLPIRTRIVVWGTLKSYLFIKSVVASSEVKNYALPFLISSMVVIVCSSLDSTNSVN